MERILVLHAEKTGLDGKYEKFFLFFVLHKVKNSLDGKFFNFMMAIWNVI
jgi:hypothetical protein